MCAHWAKAGWPEATHTRKRANCMLRRLHGLPGRHVRGEGRPPAPHHTRLTPRWPVHYTPFMDRSRPMALTLLGQSYVAWFDAAASAWRVAQDRCAAPRARARARVAQRARAARLHAAVRALPVEPILAAVSQPSTQAHTHTPIGARATGRPRCPHRLAPLSEGRIEADGTLSCSYQ